MEVDEQEIKIEEPEALDDNNSNTKTGIQDYFDNFNKEINDSVDKTTVLEPGGYFTISNDALSNTVTLVHNDDGKDTISSEAGVSYVFIVQQNEADKDDGNQNLAVYDFNENEEGGSRTIVPEPEPVQEDAIDDKNLIQKVQSTPVTTKKQSNQVSSVTHPCPYCNYTSNKKYLLSRHMKSHSQDRPHKCSVCERGFKTVASLQNHVNTHTGRKPHLCKYCTSAFTTSGELVRHVRYRHTLEKPHKCSECDYASVELSKLKRHFRCHTGERPYQCPHCTYASPDTFKLKRHLRIHTGEKPYQCDICSARFTQSNSLKAHKLTHEGTKPIFKCEICPTTCGRKTDLRIHVQKLHTSDVPVKCKRCDETFPDRWTMKQHIRIHGGDRAFKCLYCSYSATTARALENHALIHTDEKPFKCDVCNSAFKMRSLLKRHENMCHNPNYIPNQKRHKCPHCVKSFVQHNTLRKHILEMHIDDDNNVRIDDFNNKLQTINTDDMVDGTENDVSDDEEEKFLLNNNAQQLILLEVVPKDSKIENESKISLNMNFVDDIRREDTLLNGGHLVLKNDCSFDDNDNTENNDNEDDDTYDICADDSVANDLSNLSSVQKFDNLSSTIRIESDNSDINKDVKSCFGFDVDD